MGKIHHFCPDVHVYKQSLATIGKYRDVPYILGKCHDIPPYSVIFRDIPWYSVIFRHSGFSQRPFNTASILHKKTNILEQPELKLY
jgi:hypothetical protein